MSLIVTTDGLRSYDAASTTLLAWLNSLTLRLFKSVHTPAVTDHLADLGSECDFGGYAAQASNDWTGPVLSSNNNDKYTLPTHTFTATGAGLPQTVYNWGYTDAAGKLVMAQAAPAGSTLNNAGDAFSVSGPVALGQLSGAV